MNRTILALVLFFGIMAIIVVIAQKAAYEWFPLWLTGYVVTAMVALGLGLIIGERSATKHIER